MRFLFDDFVFEPEAHRLTRDGRGVSLAPKPLTLLAHLLNRRPSVVPERELRDLLWPESFVGYNSLGQVVAALRRALGEGGRHLIRNYYGAGYAFQGDVVEEEPSKGLATEPRPRWLRFLGRTGAGVFVVDRHQRIILWNAGAERLLGHPPDRVLGKPCHQVIAGARNGEPWCRSGCGVLRDLRSGALPGDVDVLTRTRRGEPIRVGFSVLAIPTRRGLLAAHIMREEPKPRPRREILTG